MMLTMANRTTLSKSKSKMGACQSHTQASNGWCEITVWGSVDGRGEE